MSLDSIQQAPTHPLLGQDWSLWPFLPVLGSRIEPVVEGSRSEDHGEFIGRLSTVAPASPGLIPEVVPCQKAHHPLREALPHSKGKVHLQRDLSKL